MRVLFTTLPAIGHFNSIMPLAVAVAAAGHDVAVCCTPAFAGELAARGLRHFPGGLGSLKAIGIEGPPPGLERDLWCWRDVFAGIATQRMVPDLIEHAARWRPEVIVRNSSEYAGCIVAERLDLPHATVASESWAGRDDRRRVVADVLSAHRRELGLAADDDGLMMHRYLHLCFAPAAWDGSLELYPPTAHFIRHTDPDRPGDMLPVGISARATRPLVLASLGTVKHASLGVFAKIIAAFRDVPVDLVAAIGRDQDPAQFGPLPAHVRVEQYIAQPLVLRQCALFVTHGGFNSVKEAASVAVPFVVIPLSGDQHYSAERIVALGLGRAVGAAQRDASAIEAAARSVLGDPGYSTRARDFAARISALAPLHRAVELLERLASERRPIHRHV